MGLLDFPGLSKPINGGPTRETVEQNPVAVYLLQVFSEEAEDVCTCHALVLMKREGGVLLALPAGAIPSETLQAAGEGDPFTIYGAHTICSISLTGPGVGADPEVVDVLVIDVDGTVMAHLSPLPDPVPDNFVSFGPDPSQLPDVSALLNMTREWISSMQEAQPLAYYSAVEEPQEIDMGEPASPRLDTAPKAAAKPKAKRPTNAALADQLAQIADVLPQLTRQISVLQKDHDEMKSALAMQAHAVPPRASQLPVSAPLKSFAKMMGSPPKNKVRAPAFQGTRKMACRRRRRRVS